MADSGGKEFYGWSVDAVLTQFGSWLKINTKRVKFEV